VAKKTRKAARTQQQQASQRKVVVFAALLAVMTATSALLLALAPAPLTAGAAGSVLFAAGTPDSLDAIFETSTPVEPGRWRSVYIHQSRSVGGNASTLGESAGGLADHFVIGNGDGCGDGEVQIAQRWHRQASAGRIDERTTVDPSCISICLIGDFNHARPTRTQVLRLTQLVTALQERCGIEPGNVHLIDGTSPAAGTKAGVGRHFPAASLRAELLP
jgi:hypothetical protein